MLLHRARLSVNFLFIVSPGEIEPCGRVRGRRSIKGKSISLTEGGRERKRERERERERKRGREREGCISYTHRWSVVRGPFHIHSLSVRSVILLSLFLVSLSAVRNPSHADTMWASERASEWRRLQCAESYLESLSNTRNSGSGESWLLRQVECPVPSRCVAARRQISKKIQ